MLFLQQTNKQKTKVKLRLKCLVEENSGKKISLDQLESFLSKTQLVSITCCNYVPSLCRLKGNSTTSIAVTILVER